MKSASVRFWFVIWVASIACYAGLLAWRKLQAHAASGRPDDPPAARATAARPPAKFSPYEIVLTDQQGDTFRADQLRGKVWLASYFFTSCPSVCLRLNQTLAQVEKDAAGELNLVSITCDPENDSPEVLNRYAERLGADRQRWRFLTGKMSDIRRAARGAFQVGVEPGTHSDRVFVVDRQGEVRGSFRVIEPDQLERLKKMLRSLDVPTS